MEHWIFSRKTVISLTLLSAFASQPLSAQDATAISGDVTSVDLISGMIAINHEPNERLKLGRGTDAFRVSGPIMLNAIRPGRHIRIAAERVNGELAIARIFTD